MHSPQITGRLVMAGSALVLGLLGVVASFAPDLVASHAGLGDARVVHVAIQVLGAAYLGFAMQNWMGRHNIIGGIYGRPVALGNLLHFLSGGLAIAKAIAGGAPPMAILLLGVYALFAVGFGFLIVRHPLGQPRDS